MIVRAAAASCLVVVLMVQLLLASRVTGNSSDSRDSTTWHSFEAVNNIGGQLKSVGGCSTGLSTATIKFLGNFSSWAGCQAACDSFCTAPACTESCQSAVWHHQDFSLPCRSHCYGRTDHVWRPVKQEKISSGLKVPQQANPQMINAGTPADLPVSTDCVLRTATWQFGRALMPSLGGFATLSDALQLQFCNDTAHGVQFPLSSAEPAAAAVTRDSAAQPRELIFHVSAVGGDDSNPGTSPGKPLATIHAAVHAARSSSAAAVATRRRRVLLHRGTHYLQETLVLGAADSGLIIESADHYYGSNRGGIEADGELANATVLSGGVPLANLSWRPSTRCRAAGCMEAKLSPATARTLFENTIPGLRRNGRRAIRGRFPNADPETAMSADALHGWISQKTEWRRPPGHAAPSASSPPPLDDDHNSSSEAPNQGQIGHVISGDDWPGVEWPRFPQGQGMPERWTGEGDWGSYFMGEGFAACSGYSPPVGYWCTTSIHHSSFHSWPTWIY
eukprot:COSAG05_NODE_1380_length_5022_cov_25.282348_1_plen_505_part_00